MCCRHHISSGTFYFPMETLSLILKVNATTSEGRREQRWQEPEALGFCLTSASHLTVTNPSVKLPFSFFSPVSPWHWSCLQRRSEQSILLQKGSATCRANRSLKIRILSYQLQLSVAGLFLYRGIFFSFFFLSLFFFSLLLQQWNLPNIPSTWSLFITQQIFRTIDL